MLLNTASQHQSIQTATFRCYLDEPLAAGTAAGPHLNQEEEMLEHLAAFRRLTTFKLPDAIFTVSVEHKMLYLYRHTQIKLNIMTGLYPHTQPAVKNSVIGLGQTLGGPNRQYFYLI
ncbi:hypothetical protein XENORESO_015378 [Xenotaenia resolanae]|uniref:Uncharacterized protein n=1 Tax=Xenotaenia resolanae TaxID=208358 RepID=A0ABV0WAL6_9TELE